MKLKKILLTLALTYFAVLVCVFAFQRSFLYFPNDTYVAPETVYAKSPLKEFPVKTEDGLDLKGWYAPAAGQPITIVYFHGNADSLQSVAPIAKLYLADGYGFLIAEFRGYSKLPGTPTEKGFYADARAYINKLISTGVKDTDIVIMGHSLGTGVATQMATEFQVKGLALLSPFLSISKMAQRRFPYLPAEFMTLDRYENFNKIPALHMPLFVAHGEKDVVVPFTDGKGLFGLANEPKQFFDSPESGHNDLYAHGLYPVSLDWLRRLVSKEKTPVN